MTTINLETAKGQLFDQYLKDAMDAAFDMETGMMHVALDKIRKLGTDKWGFAVHKCNVILEAANEMHRSGFTATRYTDLPFDIYTGE